MESTATTRLLVGIISFVAVAGCSSNRTPSTVRLPDVPTSPLPVRGNRSTITTLANNRFEVCCDHIEAVAVKQHASTWCWAACAEMLDHYRGVDMTQEQIVARIKHPQPGVNDQTANQVQIWFAMNPELLPEYDRRQAAWAQRAANGEQVGLNLNLKDLIKMTGNASCDELVEELSAGNPVLMGLKDGKWGTGHIVLVYGVTYARLITAGDAVYHYVGVTPAPQSRADANTIDVGALVIGAFDRAQTDSVTGADYAILSVKIIDPEPDYGDSQFAILADADLQPYVDFYLGKTRSYGNLKSFMKTVLPTPEEMPPAVKADYITKASPQRKPASPHSQKGKPMPKRVPQKPVAPDKQTQDSSQ
jgi:hypothetical protein